jgi:hypothetical protein
MLLVLPQGAVSASIGQIQLEHVHAYAHGRGDPQVMTGAYATNCASSTRTGMTDRERKLYVFDVARGR